MEWLKRLLTVLAVSLLASCAHAQTVTPAQNALYTSPVLNCPFGFAVADGCSALLGAGHIGTTADYPNYAAYVAAHQLSGQTWGGGAQTAQTIPWNIPGVGSYAVGPYTAEASMTNPTVSVPTNCVFNSLIGSLPLVPEISCSTASTTVDIEGYDFHPLSGQYGGSATSTGSTVTGSGPFTLNEGTVTGAFAVGQLISGGTLVYPCGIASGASPTWTLAGSGCSAQSSEAIAGVGQCIILRIQNTLTALTLKNNHHKDDISCEVQAAVYTTGSTITGGGPFTLTIGTLTSGTIAVGQVVTGGALTTPTQIAPCKVTANQSGSGSGSTWTVAGAGCANQSSTAITLYTLTAQSPVQISSGTEAIDVESNEFDGNCGYFSGLAGQPISPSVTVDDGRRISGGTTPGTSTYKYNRYHDICARPQQFSDFTSLSFYYNSIQRWCGLCSNGGNHGETFEISASTGVTGCPSACVLQLYSLQDVEFNDSLPAQNAGSCCTALWYVGDGGRKGTEVTSAIVKYNTGATNQFSNATTAQSYNASNGQVTLTTVGYTALSPGTNISVTVTGTGVTGLSGNFTVFSASGSSACLPSSCQVIYSSGVTGLSPAFAAATLFGPQMAATLVETSGTLFDSLDIESNYNDNTGGLLASSNYECVINGAGAQGIAASNPASSNVWTVTAVSGAVWPNAVIYDGDFGTLYPSIVSDGTGTGAAGTYNLSATLAAHSASSYTTNAVVTTLTIPSSGGAPHQGGTQNWSLVGNSAMTGYVNINANTSGCP